MEIKCTFFYKFSIVGVLSIAKYGKLASELYILLNSQLIKDVEAVVISSAPHRAKVILTKIIS